MSFLKLNISSLRLRAYPSLILAACMISSIARAQIASPPGSAYDNFDLRDPELQGKDTTAVIDGFRAEGAAAIAPGARTQSLSSLVSAQAALAAKIPSLHIEKNRAGNAVEAVGTSAAGEWLKPASTATHEATARAFLTEQAALFDLTAEQVAALIKFADYTNPAGNMSWVEFRQELNGTPVFQGEVRLAFSSDGALARTTGNLAAGMDATALTTQPVLTAAEAVVSAAKSIGYAVDATTLVTKAIEPRARKQVLSAGPFSRDISIELVYFAIEPGLARLAYSMILWEHVNAYYVLVDARDGTLLWRKNITAHQTQSATYVVYTNVSPAPMVPTTTLPGLGIQAPGVARNSVTLIGNEAPNTFNNLGWITDGGNTTSGNNVDAGLDIASPDGIDPGGEATGSPTRVFDFSYNPPPLGSDSPTLASYRSGVTANLFYWANIYHDRLYLLGFTEAARNFQNNNFGRGGVGNDAVSAQVQDNSNVNNANFSTPPDGTPGRMQMYIFTGPTPNRDGSIDADVFMHELTHGLSNRLHNNGSGLTTTQAGGMGEGWSDYYARCLLSKPSEDVNSVFSAGTYVTYLLTAGYVDNYYYGIRRFPYAVRSKVGVNGKPHNPLTFADIDTAQINLTDGAYPSGPIGSSLASEAHNIGEVWCMMLLEVRARIINRLGWAVGNDRALQIVTDAMKLDVASPTFIQARDSIIAADNAGFGGADMVDILNGFATRGAGMGASVSGTSTVVESFAPAEIPGTITFSDSLGNNNGFADPGEDLVFTVPLTNMTSLTDGPVLATFGNYSTNYGVMAPGTRVTRNFAYRVPATAVCGALLNIPLVISSPVGTVTLAVPLRLGAASTAIVLTQNFDTPTTPPALPTGWTTTTSGVANTAWITQNTNTVDVSNSAFSLDATTTSDASLVSPVIAITNSNLQLSFKHRYALESGFDGGVLEIKVDSGAFTDILAAGGSFLQGGYSGSVASGYGNPLAGRATWTSTQSTTVNTVVSLPASINGHNVQFRWRLGCDSSYGLTGWFVDSVVLSSITYSCAPIDTDGDGIPDGYELVHGLNPNDPTDAGNDADGDGMSNLKEYMAGTDPQDPNSVLKISSATRAPGSGNVTIMFPSVNGHTYAVEWSPSLLGGWTAVQSNIVGTGATLSVIDATAAGQPNRFYRVRTP
jgi:hypothetical protein